MQTRQDFIVNTLKPYFDNPKTCAWDYDAGRCEYLTNDGKTCAFGKWIKVYRDVYEGKNASELLNDPEFDLKLLEEAREQNLTPFQWDSIQVVHDMLAKFMQLSQITWDNVLKKIEKCELLCEIDLFILKQYEY